MKIFAHRGASGEFPENTLVAFQQAIYQEADGIELDVFEVQGEFYLWHDRYLSPPGSSDLPLWQLQAQQLREFGRLTGHQIPTLKEALQLIAGQCVVNIELKYLKSAHKLVQLLDESVSKWGFSRAQLLVSSFDHLLLKSLRQAHSNYDIGVLLASAPLSIDQIVSELQPYSLHLSIDCLHRETIRQVHQHNLQCYVYTVDRDTDIALVRELGGDGIFTNFPARARAYEGRLK